MALAFGSTGSDGIANGQDFYNEFVIADPPEADISTAILTAAASTAGDQSAPTLATSSQNLAYPTNQAVVQPNLVGDGFLTGYFLNESFVGVLSIPSFELSSTSARQFSKTVGHFIS